jgi:hypothetical protein
MSDYKFELQQRQLLDGKWAEIPVLMGAQRQELPETRSLLAAAAIIGTSLHETGGSLTELVDEVGDMLQGHVQTGILIEDELGAGEVVITPEQSEIDLRETGPSTVPTEMLFDMLYVWDTVPNAGER